MPLSLHRDLNSTPLGALQPPGDFPFLDPDRRPTVDLHDPVTGQQPHVVRRGSLDGRQDREVPLDHLEIDPDALEGALEALLRIPKIIGRDIRRMRIESGEIAFDGPMVKVHRIGLLVVIPANQFGQFAQRLDLPVCIEPSGRLGARRAAKDPPAKHHGRQEDQMATNQPHRETSESPQNQPGQRG